MTELHTFRVSFAVTDWYEADIAAPDAETAVRYAQAFYEDDGEAAFTLDLERGGTGCWQTREITP